MIDHTISIGVDFSSETIITSTDTSNLDGLVQYDALIELDHNTIDDTDSNQTYDADDSLDEVTEIEMDKKDEVR